MIRTFICDVLHNSIKMQCTEAAAQCTACPVEDKIQCFNTRRWLGGFSCFIVAVLALGAARSFTFFWASYSAATRLHNAVLGRVLRAPLAFFHANSAGRILNRFSKDQGVTDDQLPLTFFDALQSSFMVAGDLPAVMNIKRLL